jgi:hypothetical protein
VTLNVPFLAVGSKLLDGKHLYIPVSAQFALDMMNVVLFESVNKRSIITLQLPSITEVYFVISVYYKL